MSEKLPMNMNEKLPILQHMLQNPSTSVTSTSVVSAFRETSQSAFTKTSQSAFTTQANEALSWWNEIDNSAFLLQDGGIITDSTLNVVGDVIDRMDSRETQNNLLLTTIQPESNITTIQSENNQPFFVPQLIQPLPQQLFVTSSIPTSSIPTSSSMPTSSSSFKKPNPPDPIQISFKKRTNPAQIKPNSVQLQPVTSSFPIQIQPQPVTTSSSFPIQIEPVSSSVFVLKPSQPLISSFLKPIQTTLKPTQPGSIVASQQYAPLISQQSIVTPIVTSAKTKTVESIVSKPTSHTSLEPTSHTSLEPKRYVREPRYSQYSRLRTTSGRPWLSREEYDLNRRQRKIERMVRISNRRAFLSSLRSPQSEPMLLSKQKSSDSAKLSGQSQPRLVADNLPLNPINPNESVSEVIDISDRSMVISQLSPAGNNINPPSVSESEVNIISNIQILPPSDIQMSPILPSSDIQMSPSPKIPSYQLPLPPQQIPSPNATAKTIRTSTPFEPSSSQQPSNITNLVGIMSLPLQPSSNISNLVGVISTAVQNYCDGMMPEVRNCCLQGGRNLRKVTDELQSCREIIRTLRLKFPTDRTLSEQYEKISLIYDRLSLIQDLFHNLITDISTL